MPYTTQQLRDLITQEARRHGLDPRLALAVATQESGLNPAAVGDNGRSLGLFQLQPAAARDAGIDPRRRGEVSENIRGGVTYLKQRLDREGGNVERALSRYNRGTPTYQGIGDPHYVEHVMRHYREAGGGRVRDWRRELFAADSAPVRASVARDWGQELFATPAPDAATPVESPVRPRANQAPTPGPDQGARDWRQELFPTPGRV